MSVSASYKPQVDQAYINNLVAIAISNSTVPTQAPEYASAPSGFQNGQYYRNTTDGFLYIMESGLFVRVDTMGGNILQDLSGNTIIND
jgi:hypothetical protein